LQTKEVVELVKGSTADFAIVGGDFNIDPRMTNETTYQTLTAELKNAMHEFFYYIEVLHLNRLLTRNFNQYRTSTVATFRDERTLFRGIEAAIFRW
jgi:hypothetical protein